MKLILLALLPLLATATREPCHDRKGKPLSTKPFPYFKNCAKFNQCGAGILYTKDCAPGTVFNPALKVCDHPYNVPRCKDKTVNVCEGKKADVVCPSGTTILVKDGFYGRDDETTCPHKSDKNTDCAAADSLNKLKKTCNGKNKCTLKANNKIFGDPCRGTYKYVEMTYICKPDKKPSSWKKEVICEGKSGTLKCPSGEELDLRYSYYGRTSKATCRHPLDKDTRCRAKGSYGKLKANCEGKSSCTIKASNLVFGDPCFGTYKYVEVTYRCRAKKDPCVDKKGNPISSAPFATEKKCDDEFYQCANGILYTMPCASGTIFNPATGACDYRSSVKGC